jgi:hypothetical protein
MTTIDLNEKVRLRLTRDGIKFYIAYIDSLNMPKHVRDNMVDKYENHSSDIFDSQLWDVMHIFGPAMYIGNPKNLFWNNSIEIL